MKKLTLQDGIDKLPGIGPKRAAALRRYGLETLDALLGLIPLRYEDRRFATPLNALVDEQTVLVVARIDRLEQRRTARGRRYLMAAIQDDTGRANILWFQGPGEFLQKQLQQGRKIMLFGRVERRRGELPVFVHPDITLAQQGEVNNFSEQRILPVYAAMREIPQRLLQKLMYSAVHQTHIEESLPVDLCKQHALLSREAAVAAIHCPQQPEIISRARNRLAFEELIWFQWQIHAMRQQKEAVSGIRLTQAAVAPLLDKLRALLPFTLTKAQEDAWREISADLDTAGMTNRLIQGDVGSGKTIVAVLAIVQAVANGYQAAVMAPTEILARQHYEYLAELLGQLGISVGFLAAGLRMKERCGLREKLGTGELKVLIGTHAILQETVIFKHLGLIVIDEQHRFGVEQRKILQEKGLRPNTLVMSATPIPRTLALVCYGDMDISSINELPPGRKAIKTVIRGPENLNKIYAFLREQVVHHRQQAYIICPRIEETENSTGKAAVDLYQELIAGPLSGLSCGLVHGRLRTIDKDTVMAQFHRGHIQILISTTVIEVGVNVPASTIMLILDAERFGLAQLHQLRGRVGRGKDQSYCILVTATQNAASLERLKLLEQVHDGFQLAEQDLALRGPGQFLGRAQHGELGFHYADLATDMSMLYQARASAEEYFSELTELARNRQRQTGNVTL